jgi:hypothetical protein
MSLFPPYPQIRARNDIMTSAQLTAADEGRYHSADVIAAVTICVTGILVIGLWVKVKGALLCRVYQEAKATKEKAIMSQMSWYLSIRPVTRQPTTSPMSELDPRFPHIHTQIDLEANLARIGSTETTAEDAASVSTEICALKLEPFPAFDPEHQPSMESTYDIELQPLRESYQTDVTFATIESIGVAVPVKLPVAVRPSEVFNGRRTHTEAEQADLSVIGDGDDSDDKALIFQAS